MMTDLEVGFDGVERPRPSGGDCSLPASALTRQKAGGLNPGSGVGVHSEEGYPRNATDACLFHNMILFIYHYAS